MELKLYDTLTREKRVFRPLDPQNVRMYVCGPTVYDFAHIGNARPVIVFDVLFRLLQYLAKQGTWDRGKGETKVTYVRNITDVDDKINARAAERGISIGELTKATYDDFKADVKALGCLDPTLEPRATEHIAEMKHLIELIIASKRAYVLEDHVLFRTDHLKSYGALSHRSTADMRSTARGETAPKKHPMDFVLWKPSKPGEPAWPSPGGIKAPGRPGWHIECSAMSWKYLGERFDIHGGGIDLLFPHHENERAQSCRAFDKRKMAQVWMHNGFLQVEGEKMSKSLGNFLTIRELLQKLPGDVLRLQMLKTDYRSPIDWTDDQAMESTKELEEWGLVLQNRYHLPNDKKPNLLVEALCDDLNTPNAIHALRDLFSRAKKGGLGDQLEFASACKFLGFRKLDQPGLFRSGVSALNVGRESLFRYSVPIESLRAAIANDAPEVIKSELLSGIRHDGLDVKIEKNGSVTLVRGDEEAVKKRIRELVDERTAARARKDFKESDRIRDELAKMGVVLKDSKDGTTWEIAR
jgi:cysteinyl-tRNA synthetase